MGSVGDYGLGWESLIGDFLKFLLNLPPVGQDVRAVGDVGWFVREIFQFVGDGCVERVNGVNYAKFFRSAVLLSCVICAGEFVTALSCLQNQLRRRVAAGHLMPSGRHAA